MIEPMLALSTAHLTNATCNDWLHQSPFAAYQKGEYGWFLYVPDDEPEDLPADLAACLALARTICCPWLMFDRDAGTHPDLPVYCW